MNASRKCLKIVLALALVGLLLYSYGCGQSDAQGDDTELCVKCGQIKGSDLCCKADQAKCEKCGLVKGSPGCCNIPKDAKTASLCAKCGQIKGSELCCKPDQTKCEKCGLVKDSPGCCKIPQKKD